VLVVPVERLAACSTQPLVAVYPYLPSHRDSAFTDEEAVTDRNLTADVRGTVEPVEQQLARLIRSKREMEGLTLRQASEASGVSFNTIARAEKCEAFGNTLETLKRTAAWLGMEVRLCR
jgi:uncharacterized protein YerC